jgi:hypothetical protein
MFEKWAQEISKSPSILVRSLASTITQKLCPVQTATNQTHPFRRPSRYHLLIDRLRSRAQYHFDKYPGRSAPTGTPFKVVNDGRSSIASDSNDSGEYSVGTNSQFAEHICTGKAPARTALYHHSRSCGGGRSHKFPPLYEPHTLWR